MIKNAMEDIVKHKLEELAVKIPMCNCEKCKDDILATALNALGPKYISTHEGELYTKATSNCQEESNEIIIQLLKAIEKVTNNPKHIKN